MEVYDGKTLLKAGTDYTVKFKNNVKVGTATAIVTFKGKYSGTVTKDFEITPYDLQKAWDDALVTLPNFSQTFKYNGKVQKAKTPVILELEDKVVTLKEGTDYCYEYPDSDDSELVKGEDVLKLPGTYTILIEGKGNYCGTLYIEEVITDLPLMKDVKVYGTYSRR